MALILLDPSETSGPFGQYSADTVYGRIGTNETAIIAANGVVTLDGSFNRGGDVIRILGNAGSYTANIVGSNLRLTSLDGAEIKIPVGTAGVSIEFADATRTLQLVSGSVVLGSQNIADTGITEVADGTAGGGEGENFVLTASANLGAAFRGGENDDTYSGTAGTIDGDNLDGGDGSDSLTLTVTNADDNLSAFALQNIEDVTVRVSGAGGVELITGDVTDVQTFTATRLGSNLTLTDWTDLDTEFVIDRNSTAAILDVNYEAGVADGDEDTVSVNVSNSTDSEIDLDGVEVINLTSSAAGTAVNAIDVSGTGNETVNVTATGALTLAVDNAAEVNIAGSGAVTMTATVADSVVTSSGSGALKITDSGIDLTATGSSGNDTFTMAANLTAADVIDGGDGTDTLSLSNAGAALAAIPAKAQITNVENLAVATTDDGALDAITFNASIVSFNAVTFTVGDDTDTIAITKVTDETLTFTDIAAGDDTIADIDVSLSDATGKADALTLNIKNADADTALTVTDIDSAGGGIETLNLVLTQGKDVTAGADIIIGDVSIAAATVNVSGTADATLGSVVSLTQKVIDASDATGNLTINVGAAVSTVTGGAGDDTIAFGGNLTSADVVDAGDGDDTVSAVLSVAAINQATISNAETIAIDFDTAGSSFSGTNVTGAAALVLTGDVTNTVSNLDASVGSVQLAEDTDDEIVNVTYAAGSDSAHTLLLSNEVGAADYAAVTVSNNAGAFTVESAGDFAYTVTSITNAKATSTSVETAADLTLDNAGGALVVGASTSVSVTTAGGDFSISNAAGDISAAKATSVSLDAAHGDIAIGDNVETIKATSITLSATGGAITVTGDVLSQANVAVALTASGDDAYDIKIDGVLDVDFLSSLTVDASDASDVTIDDLLITGENAAGDDAATSVSLSASGTGSVATLSAISAAAAATLDLVTLTSADSGVVSLTVADNDLTITAIDASGVASKGSTINVSNLAAATEITTGAGAITVVTSDAGDTVNAGAGTLTLTLTDGASVVNMSGGNATVTVKSGAAELNLSDGVETIKVEQADVIQVNSFDVENDVFVLDDSLLEAIDGTNLVDGNGDDIATGGLAPTSVVIDDVTSGVAYVMDTQSSVLRLSGVFADAAAVDAELIANLDESNFADNDDIIVIWSDGADTHISLVAIDDADDGGAGASVDAVTVNDLAVFVGLAPDAITAASLGGTFIA